jgi:dihydroorotase
MRRWSFMPRLLPQLGRSTGWKPLPASTAPTSTAHAGIELYAEAFEQAGALDKLEAFASFNGPDFYRLPRNADTITLVKEDWQVPAAVDYLPDDPLVPLRAGETIGWKLA